MDARTQARSVGFLGFLARVTVTHVVTYVAAGGIFLLVFGAYTEAYSDPAVSSYVRSTSDPMIAYGPLAQLVRGPIIALALWPVRSVLIDRPWGWALLWGVLVALEKIAGSGGLIENLVYTKAPVWYQMLNTPEVVLQLLAFSAAIWAWERWVSRPARLAAPA